MRAENETLTVGERFHPGLMGMAAGASSIVFAIGFLLQWGERARERRILSTLTARELDDIGVSFDAASAEAAKPFWRA